MDTALALWFRSESDYDDGGVWPPVRRGADTDDADAAARGAVSEWDAALAARIRAGDDSAFRDLYLLRYAELAEYAAGLLNDRAAAHDVVQDLFLSVWRGRSTWAPGHIAAYLYRSVRNRSLNVLRGAKRRERLIGQQPVSAVGVSEIPLAPDDDVHLRRFRDALDRAIHSLADNRREIATLRWRHGKSLSEIAAITGKSVKAVGMSLARTRATLQPIVDTYLRDG